MRILILFATYSHSTAALAQFIQTQLEQHDMTCTIKEVLEATQNDLKTYDIIAMGSPSWLQDGKEGQPHAHFFEFMKTYDKSSFEGMRFVFFGCGDKTYAHYCGAVRVLEHFVMDRKGTSLVEPLCMENFFVGQEENEEQVVKWVKQVVEKM